jgi:hypothetical protein
MHCFDLKDEGGYLGEMNGSFIIMLDVTFHYEKSCLSKPHYPTTKNSKKIHIQLLCNDLLGITTIV